MIGKAQHWEPLDVAGKCGVMAWKLLNLLIFNKWQGLNANLSQLNLHMDQKEYACSLKEKKNVFELIWNNAGIKYKDIFHQAEKEYSAYNFEFANTESLLKNFDIAESECKSLLEKKLPLPAYDQCLKASHIFNLLDARGVIGVAQRTEYISRIRELAKGSGQSWLESQK